MGINFKIEIIKNNEMQINKKEKTIKIKQNEKVCLRAIYEISQKEVKIKQSRRAKDAGNQKAVIRHTELQSAERKKKIGYKSLKNKMTQQ